MSSHLALSLYSTPNKCLGTGFFSSCNPTQKKYPLLKVFFPPIRWCEFTAACQNMKQKGMHNPGLRGAGDF